MTVSQQIFWKKLFYVSRYLITKINQKFLWKLKSHLLEKFQIISVPLYPIDSTFIYLKYCLAFEEQKGRQNEVSFSSQVNKNFSPTGPLEDKSVLVNSVIKNWTQVVKVTSHDDDQASDKVKDFVSLGSIFIHYMNNLLYIE